MDLRWFKFAISRPALLVAILLACLSLTSIHAEERVKNILFIFSWSQDLPWQRELEKGFEQEINRTGKKPHLFYEYMDAGRFQGPDQVANFSNYIDRKYSGLPIDYVIFESTPAARLLQARPGLFGKAKRLALNPSITGKTIGKLAAVVPVRIDLETSVENILKLSRAKTVYLVGGSTRETAERFRVVSEILARTSPERKVIPLIGLPMNELLMRVEKTKPGSIILYLTVFQDGDGKRFIPFDAARAISARANAPMYSFWTSLLGSGIVGGYMLSGELVGKEAAVLVSSGLKDGYQVQADITDRFHDYYFDWHQLNRWNISPSALPRNSKILYKHPNFLREHLIEISITLILALLIVLAIRYRELKKYNRELDTARRDLQSANLELGRVQISLEEKNEMLRELSITDSLTELNNRAYLDEKLNEEFNRIDRHPDILSIILVDIDRFKHVNDKYGHQAGDEVLVNIAKTLRRNIRSIDSIGRWGGEEFIIICPGSDEKQSLQLAEKLRQILQELEHPKVGRVTCSFGVASHELGMSQVQLIKNADKALYESKSSGRNRVTGGAALSGGVVH